MKRWIFGIMILLAMVGFGWACDEPGCTHINNYGGAGGSGGAGGAGGSVGPVTASVGPVTATGGSTGPVTATGGSVDKGAVSIDMGNIKYEAKRELAAIPGSGPAEARFREDQRMIPDWRVYEIDKILSRVRVWEYEQGKKLSANLDLKKQHKNLLRVMNKETTMVEYTTAPPLPKDDKDMVIFLGWIPMSPDLKRGGLIAWLSNDGPNDLTAFNMIGNQVVAACNAGATHLIKVKEGFMRGGHSEVDFLGIAGGGSSVFEDGTKRAGGVSGSIGPSTTTMDAWDMDRPFVVAEAWCRVSDMEKKPFVDYEALQKAEERKAKIDDLQRQLDELKKK